MTTTPLFTLVSRGGARLLHTLPGWTLSQKGTSLYRRIGPAHVSVYTKPAQDGTFYAKIELPLDAEDERDAAMQALALARRALP